MLVAMSHRYVGISSHQHFKLAIQLSELAHRATRHFFRPSVERGFKLLQFGIVAAILEYVGKLLPLRFRENPT